MPDEVPVSVIEQRLRDAFATAAETVAPHSIRDLASPAGQRGRVANRGLARVRDCWHPRGWDRQLRPPRFYEHALIPLAAAAAVALIATAMSVVAPRAFPAAPGAGRGGHGTATGTEVGHARDVASASAIAAGYPSHRLPRRAAPRYFVGVRQVASTRGPVPGARSPVSGTVLTIYSAATGRTVASLGEPARGRYYQAVAALGGGQTFVAAAVATASQDCRTWFYRFSLGPRGRPRAWKPLSVPVVTGKVLYNNALAGSADGNVLAYSASMCTQNLASRLGVIRLANGETRTWSTLWPAMPRNLSLSADGTLLSFVGNPSSGAKGGTPARDAAWTLRTDAAAGPLARHYRRVLRAPGGVQAATFSPTGTVLFAMTARNPRDPALSSDVGAYDAATGKPIGLVQVLRYASGTPGFTPDTSGRYVLVYPTGRAVFQELDLVTGRLVTVSLSQATFPVAAAW